MKVKIGQIFDIFKFCLSPGKQKTVFNRRISRKIDEYPEVAGKKTKKRKKQKEKKRKERAKRAKREAAALGGAGGPPPPFSRQRENFFEIKALFAFFPLQNLMLCYTVTTFMHARLLELQNRNAPASQRTCVAVGKTSTAKLSSPSLHGTAKRC